VALQHDGALHRAQSHLEAALAYASSGWAVFPVHPPSGDGCSCGNPACEHIGKHPRTQHGHLDATCTESAVRQWWGRWPDANVGIATGAKSGLIILDVDPRHGGDETLAEWVRVHGELPNTVEVCTGGGGRHIYFAHLRGHVRSLGLAPGVDVKADGGYVVAPPSLHASGRRYAWEVSSHPDDTGLAPPPDWLLALLASPPAAASTGPSSEVLQIRGGGRNRTLTSLGGTMRRRGMSAEAILAALGADNRRRCVPPLPDTEVQKIARSVSRYPAAGTAHPVLPPDHGSPADPQPRVQTLAFPERALIGWPGEFAELYGRYTEAPRSFYFMAALTCLGNLLSHRITLASVIRPQPRLYTVILGESGDDRKSTTIRLTVEFFLEALGPEAFGVSHGVGSAEGLAEELSGSRELLLVCDEFKTFVNKARIESSVLLPCVNTLFELNRYHSATKGHRIALEDAHLSLLAACTKDTYSTIFSRAFTDIGFINRLLLVLDSAKRRFHLPPQIPADERAALRRRLQDLIGSVDALCKKAHPYPMPLTPEADETFRRWYEALPRSIFSKRLDTYGHRLMPLLAVGGGSPEVTQQVAEATVALLDYEFAVRRIADPVDAENKTAELEERVRRALARGPLSEKGRAGLRKTLHYERYGYFIWNAAISNLEKAGDIRRDDQGLLALTGEA
jgi:hypothetical protein